MKKVNLGGDRLGSGAKNNVFMHGYERSNHDLSYLWKSTMAPGTLIPFMVMPMLPGDTFDINLNALVKTLPTNGPLFGSFKLQLDVFSCPVRLYHRMLHNNTIGVGLKMNTVKLPILRVDGDELDPTSDIPIEEQQINPSSLLAYLGIRGLAIKSSYRPYVHRYFNAVPYLAYFDIFKNYYANLQEETAYIIHGSTPYVIGLYNEPAHTTAIGTTTIPTTILQVMGESILPENVTVTFTSYGTFKFWELAATPLDLEEIEFGKVYQIRNLDAKFIDKQIASVQATPSALPSAKPKLSPFPLANIDQMKMDILAAPTTTPVTLYNNSIAPYNLPLSQRDGGSYNTNSILPLEGILVKTYQSDIFNNWLKTESIVGADSVTELTRISTVGDSFTLDTLNLSKKVYDMLNRIVASGGSYEDWLSAVYDHNSKWRAETPVYLGGLSKEVIFQEVVQNAPTEGQPLGWLGGKGTLGDKHKGGHIIARCDEPSYLIGIVSLTPRIDYSQGNEWHTSAIMTMDDFHKPALDGIGFQDLLVENMAFFGITETDGMPIHESVGKIPAWLPYMTNFNKSYGEFASPTKQMYMTLNRLYDYETDVSNNIIGVKDLTTYIDPSKFNYAFAYKELTAQNFWTQIGVSINARRKMSAKIIPNL